MTEQPPDHYLCLMGCGRPRRDRSHLDGGCYARLRADLANLRFGYIHLGNEISALRAAKREGTRHGKSESRPPLNVDLVDVRWATEETVLAWGAYIAENHQPAIRGPLERTVPTVIRWLLDQALGWVSNQTWVWEFANDIGDLRHRAYSAAPWQRVRIDLPTPCPDCRMLTLSTYPGDAQAVCRQRACGRQIPIASMKETKRWTRVAARAS